MNNNREKFVAYMRVSTTRQRTKGRGLEDQMRFIEAVMHDCDGELIGEFKESYSGTDLAGCRELWKAVKMVRETGATLVVAYHDRFRDTEGACRVLREVDGRVWFLDLMRGANEAIIKTLIAFAEEQARIQRLKTTRALQKRKEEIATKGFFITNNGIAKTKLGGDGFFGKEARIQARLQRELQEEDWYRNSVEALWIRRQLKNGMSTDYIISEFNEMGYKTRSGRRLSLKNYYKLKARLQSMWM